MATHYYSEKERAAHLQRLVEAIDALLPELQKSGKYLESIAGYDKARMIAKQLLVEGFDQSDLSALGRSVPRLFWLHKEWLPPLEPSEADRGLSESPWFQHLEPLESAVASAAEKLRVVGEY